jgi:DNA-binding response OmpR family regulator
MIIDDQTFTDLTMHLRKASDGLLGAARELAEVSDIPSEQITRAVTRALDSLTLTNQEFVILQKLLRVVWDTNREHAQRPC